MQWSLKVAFVAKLINMIHGYVHSHVWNGSTVMRITFINYNGSNQRLNINFLLTISPLTEIERERKKIEVCEWVTKSLKRKLYEETLLFMISPICACGERWQVVSLVCVCLAKSNLLNKFIFSDSTLDFRWLCRLFSTEELEKWNAKTCYPCYHKKSI